LKLSLILGENDKGSLTSKMKIVPLRYYKPWKTYFAVLVEHSRTGVYPVKELVDLLFKKYKEIPLLICQPKYDGIHCIGSHYRGKVKIFTEDGHDITHRVPTIAEALKKLPDVVVEGELEGYKEGRHVPRELVIGKIHERKPITDLDLVFTIFELPWLKGKNLTKETNLTRLRLLHKLPITQSSINPKPPLNKVPYILAKTRAGLQKAANKFCSVKHFEGMVCKFADGLYDPSSKYPYLIKFKKFLTVAVIISEVIPTKKQGIYNYEVCLAFDPSDNIDPQTIRTVKGRKYTRLAKTYNTSLKFNVGDVITLRAFNFSLTKVRRGSATYIRVSAYAPQVDKKISGRPNTVKEVIRVAKAFGILHED